MRPLREAFKLLIDLAAYGDRFIAFYGHINHRTVLYRTLNIWITVQYRTFIKLIKSIW